MPEHGLREIQLQLVAQIGAAEYLGTSAGAPRSEDISKHVPEDVAERIATEAAATSAARSGLDARMAVLVVGRALVLIGEDFAGFLGLFEAFLRILVVG